jgi:hypothetical protein
MRFIQVGFLALACTAAHATDREFKDIVTAISDEFHAKPTHIPLMGLVNMVTYVARPAGTKHIDIAVFENLDAHERSGADMAQSVRRAVGSAWRPFVQVHSNRSGHEETTFVYMRMEGHDCKLLIANIESKEATVVQLKLNPEALQKWIVSPGESATHHYGAQDAERDRDRDEP